MDRKRRRAVGKAHAAGAFGADYIAKSSASKRSGRGPAAGYASPIQS